MLYTVFIVPVRNRRLQGSDAFFKVILQKWDSSFHYEGLDSAQPSSVAGCPNKLWSFHLWRLSKFKCTSLKAPELCWPCSEQGRDNPWSLPWMKFLWFQTRIYSGAELDLQCLSVKELLSSLLLTAKHWSFLSPDPWEVDKYFHIWTRNHIPGSRLADLAGVHGESLGFKLNTCYYPVIYRVSSQLCIYIMLEMCSKYAYNLRSQNQVHPLSPYTLFSCAEEPR